MPEPPPKLEHYVSKQIDESRTAARIGALVELPTRLLGRLWTYVLIIPWLSYLYRRAAKFQVTIIGAHHLTSLGDRPYLLISNHNFPLKTELWPTGRLPFLMQYHQSADSFIFRRIVRDLTNRIIQVVAVAGVVYWPTDPLRYWAARHIVQVFFYACMERLRAYIPVEKIPGGSQRKVIGHIEKALRANDPLLIFPQTEGFWRTMKPENFGALACYVARKYDLPVIPACIVNSQLWKPGNKVTVAFGEPFLPTGMSKEEINYEMLARIKLLAMDHMWDIPRPDAT